MVSYRVDVRPILEEIGASIDIVDSLDLGRLCVGDEQFVLRSPAPFNVSVSNAGAGIVAHGTVTADVTATCSRCLCEFEDHIEGDVIGFYLRPGDEPPEDEDAESVDAEGAIDIGPAVLAALVIEAPFAPIHDEECRGLCATCGANLNEGPCDCGVGLPPEHPFAKLQSLFPSDTSESPEE